MLKWKLGLWLVEGGFNETLLFAALVHWNG